MRVKTYRDEDAKAVLNRIKAELGPEAVILSTRNYDENGRTYCEVTAALEQQDEAGSRAKAAARLAGQDVGLGVEVPGWGQWHREWSQIREHITALLRPQLDFTFLSPRQRLAVEYLERQGVDGQVILDIHRELKNNPELSVLQPLERIVPVRPWGAPDWPQRAHAVAGPHGSGKTMALIRMALVAKKADPSARIRFANADLSRMSGRLVLRHLAELSEFSYQEADDAQALAKTLANGKNYDLTLIDLPGLEKGQTLERLACRLGLDSLGDVPIHLVFSPHFAPEQLKSFARQYFSPLAASLIWTKLDEASQFGALVNASAVTGLPASVLSYGASMKDSLVPATHTLLWRLLFKRQLPGKANGHA